MQPQLLRPPSCHSERLILRQGRRRGRRTRTKTRKRNRTYLPKLVLLRLGWVTADQVSKLVKPSGRDLDNVVKAEAHEEGWSDRPALGYILPPRDRERSPYREPQMRPSFKTFEYSHIVMTAYDKKEGKWGRFADNVTYSSAPRRDPRTSYTAAR